MTGIVSWRFLPEPRTPHRLPQPAPPGGDMGLPLRRPQLPAGRGRLCPFRVLQSPAALGPCAGLAPASGGGRLLGPVRRLGATIRGRPTGGLICAPDRACWSLHPGGAARLIGPSRTPTTSSVIASTGRSTHSGTRADEIAADQDAGDRAEQQRPEQRPVHATRAPNGRRRRRASAARHGRCPSRRCGRAACADRGRPSP